MSKKDAQCARVLAVSRACTNGGRLKKTDRRITISHSKNLIPLRGVVIRASKIKTMTKEEKRKICLDCPSLCCHDLAMPITKPRTKYELEEMRWQLRYDTVHVAIRNLRWHLVVKGRCIYLDDDNMCTIYQRRPQRCRRHNPPDCERFGPWYDTLITTPEDLDAYLKKEKRKRTRRSKRRKKKK